MIRILVVDDLKALLDVVKYILESYPDYIVDTASSVAQARTFLNENTYDIIISDYYMPETNGLEFLKEVRSDNPSIPFVIQTGQGDEIIAIEALQSGADFFLEKGSEGPLQYLAFTQIINLLVSKHRMEERMTKELTIFHNLFEENRDGLVFVNGAGNIQDVNSAFLNITGCQKEQILEMSFYDLLPDEWVDLKEKALNLQAFQDGQPAELRRDYMRCTGELISLSIRVQVLRNSDNEAEGMWIIIRDMSGYP